LFPGYIRPGEREWARGEVYTTKLFFFFTKITLFSLKYSDFPQTAASLWLIFRVLKDLWTLLPPSPCFGDVLGSPYCHFSEVLAFYNECKRC
jgi:hypothetical protein